MSDLAKTYDPVGTEARWQKAWEDEGAFHPDPAAQGEPFAVVIPPPNVTGSLHMGHAFNTALFPFFGKLSKVLSVYGCNHS